MSVESGVGEYAVELERGEIRGRGDEQEARSSIGNTPPRRRPRAVDAAGRGLG